jgi:hypothetical protein
MRRDRGKQASIAADNARLPTFSAPLRRVHTRFKGPKSSYDQRFGALQHHIFKQSVKLHVTTASTLLT